MRATEITEVHCVKALAAKDFKSGAHPIWCPGCGDYGVLAALEDALALHGRPPHEVVLVSGIGCSSRLPAYTTCYGFHGVHGRALALATGLKLARPDLDVITVGGGTATATRLVAIILSTPAAATSIWSISLWTTACTE
jgi:pyruvate/2-oxoacid:ferredoxin oxidoreductase beta subunit